MVRKAFSHRGCTDQISSSSSFHSLIVAVPSGWPQAAVGALRLPHGAFSREEALLETSSGTNRLNHPAPYTLEGVMLVDAL